ncbi:MAG TPA: alpha/beta fold hydrolase [Gammaproteobacteria bacterium]|nr:alpha/beta fold hydrolase [Gammaproteobacteria bacterium]
MIIEAHRADLQRFHVQPQSIIDTNSPYELVPSKPLYSGNRLKYGALLLHGLLDCPFSLKDIGEHLQSNGILCRATLLPGHGTTPSDLLNTTYHEWIETLHYGIESLRQQVEKIFLIGYSTGGTLSIYQALQDKQIDGIILLAPALKIKTPIDMLFHWQRLMKWMSNKKEWLCYENETDYARYSSVPFNPVIQLTLLTRMIHDLMRQHRVTCPVFIAASREDEVISSQKIIDFFSRLTNPKNKLLLYTSSKQAIHDQKILTRVTRNQTSRINHFSHVSIPFAPHNPHYGEDGDYFYASHLRSKEYIFGAYNRLDTQFFDILYNLGLVRKKRRELTYNPDFDFMMEKIIEFVFWCER